MSRDEPEEAVADRLLQQQLEELAPGRAAPDRREAILARAAGVPARRNPQLVPWLVAAVLMLGIATTIAVATSTRAGAFPGDGPEPKAAAHTIADTEPAPPPPPLEVEPTAETGKPLPRGTDPDDLRAMRSAEAMLDAERRLKEKLAGGKVAGVDELLPFETLSAGWTYDEGLRGMPPAVRKLSGRRVVMIGFMLPIDEVNGMREFLLVQSLWSCCYGTPPDLHQIVRCVMPATKPVDYVFEPVMLVGDFRVEATVLDGYVVDVFQLHVDFLEVLQ